MDRESTVLDGMGVYFRVSREILGEREPAVSVLLPVYNYDATLLQSRVRTVLEFLRDHFRESEIVIVDDNSDSVTKTAIAEASKLPTVSAITYDSGPSRRENLAASFAHARHPIVCYMDIDLATDISYLPALIDAIREGHDIAIGSRYRGLRAKRELHRLVVSKVYNFLLWVLFGTWIVDHTCGFKAFRQEVIVDLTEKLGYDGSGRRGWFWDAEMLIRAQYAHLRIAEIPVAWAADSESTFSFRRELRLVPHLYSFWWSTRDARARSA